MRRLHLWLAAALIGGGCLYLVLPAVHAAVQRRQVAAFSPAQAVSTPAAAMELGVPTRLELPRLGIRLNVQAGGYNPISHTWLLDTFHAFYAQQGMIDGVVPATPLIYGHALPSVFGSLDGVGRNEQLVITRADGRTLLFRYTGDQVVSPNDDSVLHTHLPTTVLVMTCTGQLSESRRVLHFTYEGLR